MSTPVVTEIRAKLQRVEHDPFIDDVRAAGSKTEGPPKRAL
jgi:hypothetical protein